jgi:5-methyltetrahydropteroyltriglutamate--homocysteine methyltransferase
MTICNTIANVHYDSRPDMAMAFADLLNQEAKELEALGADIIQFDEPAFNVFMDDVKDWGVTALERAAAGLSCKTAVHICYGYGIEANNQWKQTLGSEWRQYEETFPALNQSKIDMVSLECANSHVPLSLMKLLSDTDVMVGVIDVASLDVETPEQVAATIRAALEHVDAARLYPCTNCGLAPLPRDVAVGKLRALGAGAALARAEIGL